MRDVTFRAQMMTRGFTENTMRDWMNLIIVPRECQPQNWWERPTRILVHAPEQSGGDTVPLRRVPGFVEARNMAVRRTQSFRKATEASSQPSAGGNSSESGGNRVSLRPAQRAKASVNVPLSPPPGSWQAPRTSPCDPLNPEGIWHLSDQSTLLCTMGHQLRCLQRSTHDDWYKCDECNEWFPKTPAGNWEAMPIYWGVCHLCNPKFWICEQCLLERQKKKKRPRSKSPDVSRNKWKKDDDDDKDDKRNKDPTRSVDAWYTDPWKWSDDSWTSNSGKSSHGTAY